MTTHTPLSSIPGAAPAWRRTIRGMHGLVLAIVWLLVGWVGTALATNPTESHDTTAVLERAAGFDRLHSLLVLHQGEPIVEHVQGGPGLDRPANIKSLSKTILATLGGIAIDRGVVESTEQPIVELIDRPVPDEADERIRQITFGHALSMQAGLESTSGGNYGRWVQSRDWVAHVLGRSFVDQPGGAMIYSTGTTHLVSAALTGATGQSTLSLAREWLGEPLEIAIPEWMTDPQGIYFGGNEMRLSPRALARFGEMVRQGGRFNGQQVVSREWLEAAWTPRGRSNWTGHDYGYGWFIIELAGLRTYYGRGFGGQVLYIVPERALTIVVTSDPAPPSAGGRYFRQLGSMVEELIIPMLE